VTPDISLRKFKLGKLNRLIFKRGSLAGALEATSNSGTASYNKILKIRATMDNLGEELKHFSKGAEVTKEFFAWCHHTGQ
jgi:hypothetical protein